MIHGNNTLKQSLANFNQLSLTRIALIVQFVYTCHVLQWLLLSANRWTPVFCIKDSLPSLDRGNREYG
jgi:hypothetical protein